jgi:Tfp pilus assembly protein PilV
MMKRKLSGENIHLIGNKKGITLIEVVVAMLLLVVGVLGLLSLMPSAWRSSGRSDLLGRATGILQEQLQAAEIQIMNPVLGVTTWNPVTSTVYSNGINPGLQGDVPFSVTTSSTPTPAAPNNWTVKVQVTWPGNTVGISESVIVSKQEYFRY